MIKLFPILLAIPFFMNNCRQLKQQPPIAGNWQMMEIVSDDGRVQTSPGLTVLCFFKDGTYMFYYSTRVSRAVKYYGTYLFSDGGKTLETKYTFNNTPAHDKATILELTDSTMIIKDQRPEGDTMKFRKMTGILKT